MLYLESPTNPRMKIIDIEVVCRLIREINKDIIIILDNSFLTPFFQVNKIYLFFIPNFFLKICFFKKNRGHLNLELT